MTNGNYVAIEPREGFAPWSVGWTCFQSGRWEPHVERLLNERLRPDMVAMDIGANIGYFSAVMAKKVGVAGHVWSFEPVPSTYRQLCICRDVNHLSQMTALDMALGDANGVARLRYDVTVTGSASIHGHMSASQKQCVDVKIRRLDDLCGAGVVAEPNLIKIDVEGHELPVFEGAKALLRKARPEIIFEYNTEAALAAGWNLTQLASLLISCGGYRFSKIGEHFCEPIDPFKYQPPAGSYIDLFAVPADRS